MSDDGRRARLGRRAVSEAAPEAARYTLWDTDLKGFGLRIAPTGTKTYVVRYRAGGGRRGTLRQLVIGRHGALTPEKAREAAEKALAAAQLGEDPQADKAAKREELTVSELCDLYLVEGVATKKASTVYIDRTRVARHIKPTIGRLKVSDVERSDVERMMRDVAEGRTRHPDAPWVRGGRAAAARAVGLLSGIFAFAVVRKMRADNPASGVDRFRDVRRERFLSPSELGRLGDTLTAMEAAGADWRPITIVRLLALSGARKNEIARLRWSEVDAERGFLRLEDSKTGQKTVRVGAPVLELLAALPRAKGAVYAFPDHADPSGPYRQLDWAWVGIRKRADMADLRLHDLRHSFASVGLASGQTLPLIGKLLGHAHVATTSRYAHLADDPVQAAAERISQTIHGALKGQSGEVISLKVGARG